MNNNQDNNQNIVKEDSKLKLIFLQLLKIVIGITVVPFIFLFIFYFIKNTVN